jgi:hypothetical protein
MSFTQGYPAVATELVFISDPGSVRRFTKQQENLRES